MIILDDAFQCHRLHRDLDIVVIDASGSSRISRESPKALKRADLIIANHVYNSEQAQQVDQKLRVYSLAPILHMKPVLEKISREKSAVFCGIGNPEHFLALLAKQQIPIATCLLALDHEMPSEKTWADFIKSCEFHQVSRMLCTEKDFHRLKTSPLAPLQNLERGIKPVKMHLEVF